MEEILCSPLSVYGPVEHENVVTQRKEDDFDNCWFQRQREEVSSEIHVNPENFFAATTDWTSFNENIFTVVNQNGSRFLYLKQTLSRTSGAKSRNGYSWTRKLQKSQEKAHLVKPSEVKGVVLKKFDSGNHRILRQKNSIKATDRNARRLYSLEIKTP